MEAAKAVCSAAMGGMVLLAAETYRRLVPHRVQQSALLLYAGMLVRREGRGGISAGKEGGRGTGPHNMQQSALLQYAIGREGHTTTPRAAERVAAVCGQAI